MHEEIEIRKQVVRSLKKVMDPELGVNIVDLGLIYQLGMEEDTFVVVYTITTPACPVSRYLHKQIEASLRSVEAIDAFEARMVYHPEWSVEMIREGVEFFAVPPPVIPEDQ